MKLPFSIEQFFGVIRQYNETVWPMQVLWTLAALAAVVLVFTRWPKEQKASVAISALLALLWAWVGLVYHLAFFTAINPAAWVFGGLALAGAALLAWHGVWRRELTFAWHATGRALTGLVLVVYALLVYPLWSTAAGHGYPELPTFGLPCPTTIFTIGMLALAQGRRVRRALVVPVLWSLVGGQAAFLLDVAPDYGLALAGLVALGLMWHPPVAEPTLAHA